ncbi:MAG: hypothetical protein NTZ80_01215, partial [Patescibacteria group bacterium]|nr:hypothetical protein [Patescibacteria group bacterium]
MNMDMGYEINECARRKRNRLKNYDYSQSGWYFITICVKNREQFFGEVQDGKMSLNEYGKIAENQWLWLGEQYDYVRLDTYIVMPDHLHGILIIENDINRRDNPRIVPTGIVPNNNDCAISINNRHHNLLSKTISAFKTTSSKLIHQAGLERFIW